MSKITSYILGTIAGLYIALSSSTADAKQYTAKKHETPAIVAKAVKLPLEDILECNPSLKNNEEKHLKSKQKIRLNQDYKTKNNDTLEKIADKYHLAKSEIELYNPQVSYTAPLKKGTTVYLPCSASPKTKTVKYSKELSLRVIKNPKLNGTSQCARYDRTKPKDQAKIRKYCSFYDTHKIGNPLLKVNPEDLEKKLSKNIKLREFVMIEPEDLPYINEEYTFRANGHTYYQYARIDKKFLEDLERIRSASKEPLHIDEGFRSLDDNITNYWEKHKCKDRKAYTIRKGKKKIRVTEHEAKLKCMPDGPHPSGNAADLKLNGNRKQLIEAAEKVLKNHGGIGYGSTVLHVDDRKKRARWRY